MKPLLLLILLFLCDQTLCGELLDIAELDEDHDWSVLQEVEYTMRQSYRLIAQFATNIQLEDDEKVITRLQRETVFDMEDRFNRWFNCQEDNVMTLRDEIESQHNMRLAIPYFSMVLFDKQKEIDLLKPLMVHSTLLSFGRRAKMLRNLFREIGLIKGN